MVRSYTTRNNRWTTSPELQTRSAKAFPGVLRSFKEGHYCVRRPRWLSESQLYANGCPIFSATPADASWCQLCVLPTHHFAAAESALPPSGDPLEQHDRQPLLRRGSAEHPRGGQLRLHLGPVPDDLPQDRNCVSKKINMLREGEFAYSSMALLNPNESPRKEKPVP